MGDQPNAGKEQLSADVGEGCDETPAHGAETNVGAGAARSEYREGWPPHRSGEGKNPGAKNARSRLPAITRRPVTQAAVAQP